MVKENHISVPHKVTPKKYLPLNFVPMIFAYYQWYVPILSRANRGHPLCACAEVYKQAPALITIRRKLHFNIAIPGR